MIKAQLDDDDYVDVEIMGRDQDIAKELSSILNNLSKNTETQLIVIAAITEHLSNYKSE